ncbi:MAG: ketopantoate reductase family protein [Candidatus Sericytochromatia bacterium]|nr:ketopantoate reductase family protein [Candidatus Sericytochromatia bacterium]
MSVVPAHPPVWIIGAGAIGLYLAAHLSHVTHVTLVARGPRADVLRDHGFVLTGADTGTYRLPVVTLANGLQVPPEALVIIATKATDLEKLVAPLAAALHAEQRVALVQNGLGVHKFVRAYMPTASLVRLTCWVGVTLEAGREAVVAGAPLFELGEEADRPVGGLQSWLELLNAANLRARHGGSVAEVEWRKALLNLAVSGVCAILDERNGAILESPELREVIEDVLAEAVPVAAAEGVVLGPPDVERVYTALHNTRENWNAMLQDLRRGALTEMSYLNAAVDRLARRHGLRAPVNATVARLIVHLARSRTRWRAISPEALRV